jgi:hypothetical protein
MYIIIAVLVAIISVIGLIPRAFVNNEIAYNDIIHKTFTPNMNIIQEIPPNNLIGDNNNYNFGRYSKPISNPSLHDLNIFQKIFQKKQWHFNSFSNDKIIIGLAIADMGYIETSFIYICDVHNHFHDKVSFLLPYGFGASIVSNSSINACSSFNSSFANFNINICFDDNINGWNIKANGILESNTKISFTFKMYRSNNMGNEFSMIYPLGKNRASYTHKIAGLRTNGDLFVSPSGNNKDKFNEINLQNITLMGLSDYTRTLARRFTEWWWVALSYENELGLHGLQLSDGVYKNPIYQSQYNGKSVIKDGDLENILWINETAYYIDSKLTFSILNGNNKFVDIFPGQGSLNIGSIIYITSEDKSVDLKYTCIAQLPTKVNTPLFSGKLLHSYGHYSGSISAPLAFSNNEESIENDNNNDGNNDDNIKVLNEEDFLENDQKDEKEIIKNIVYFKKIPGILEDHYAYW